MVRPRNCRCSMLLLTRSWISLGERKNQVGEILPDPDDRDIIAIVALAEQWQGAKIALEHLKFPVDRCR